MPDLVGQTLGNYRIESRLGSGGMGEVYRAVHIHLNRPAAIKVLHTNQAADPTFQARFLREARAAAALSHPHIVEVFDFGEQDQSSYLVMELVPDGSLRTLLRQRSAEQGWSLALGLDLVRQAAEGLAYAHSHGMVHRDIKPDNLLLQRLGPPVSDPDAERYTLKISDFGLARLVEGTENLTVTGMVMGTPTYMSPEQCQGGELDGRSDLYSLGVVLYEVATGSPPFRVKSLSEAVFKHISAPPEPPRNVRPDIPVALERVILRCLEKRPEDRYATGTELIAALDGAVSDSELMTVITTQSGKRPPSSTPTPSNPSDPSAPSAPSSPPTSPASPPLASGAYISPTAETVASPLPSHADVTVREPAPAPAARPSAVSAVWQRLPQSSQSRTRLFGIAGIGVLALIVILIVALGPGRKSAGAQTVRTPNTHTPTAVPTPSPTPVESVKYQASLSTSDNAWPISAHSFFANGGYEVAGAWISFAPGGDLSNLTISARMRQISGPSDKFYGILLRAKGYDQYYLFAINSSQQWTFALVTNGNGTAIVSPTSDSHINTGLNASNTLTVRANGKHFIFYANGVELGQADDGTISSGKTGLMDTVGDLAVVYNDFQITVPA